MSIVKQLSALVCREVAVALGGRLAAGAAGVARDFFLGHGRLAERALAKATARAWRALEVALAGESLLSRLDSADDAAYRERLRAYLRAVGFGPDGPAAAELRRARDAGLLEAGPIADGELERAAAEVAALSDPPARLAAESRAVAGLSSALRAAGYPALAAALELRPGGADGLLPAAVRYFFRLEAAADERLARTLQLAAHDDLAAGQAQILASLAQVPEAVLDRLAGLGESLGRIDRAVESGFDEVRTLLRQLLAAGGLARRDIRPSDSFSIRGGEELRLLAECKRRIRAAAEAGRPADPELLLTLAKAEVLGGDAAGAAADAAAVAATAPDAALRADALFVRFLAELERPDPAAALSAYREAVRLAPAKALFPPDRYEPLEVLGSGGFGIAFRCRHLLFDRDVVVKALKEPALGARAEAFAREARTLSGVRHPGVVEVQHAEVWGDGRAYLQMEWFDGSTLEALVERQGTLSPTDALGLLRATLPALQAAHDLGVVHRDIKPANILVRRDPATADGWRVKLIDFGLAAGGPDHAPRGVAGTAGYAAPEQMAGGPVGPPADLFGLGRTVYFALFGTPNPDGQDCAEQFQQWRAAHGEAAERLQAALRLMTREALAKRAQSAGDIDVSAARRADPELDLDWAEACACLRAGRDYPAFLKERAGRAHAWHAAAASGNARALVLSGDALLEGGDPAAAHALHLRAATASEPAAMWRVGVALRSGRGVAADRRQSLSWLGRAADAGDALAAVELGLAYESGEGVGRDPFRAAEFFRQAAERGAAAGAYRLGLLHESGEGAPRDDSAAAALHRRAADAGHPGAMARLSSLFDAGRGVAQDAAAAADWRRRAAEAGDPAAMRDHAWACLDGPDADFSRAAHWYRRAADAGDALAMIGMATLHSKGFGVPQDAAKAEAWLERAAAGGDPAIERKIASLYAEGTGLEKDRAKARQWYERAAGRGDADAMGILGIMGFEDGGAAGDAEALRWMRRLGERGMAWAAAGAAKFLENGRGGPQDLEAALALYERAAAGDPAKEEQYVRVGALSAAHYRANGLGCVRDDARAAAWYRRAAELGDADAMFQYGALVAEGRGVPADLRAGLDWYRRAADAGCVRAMANLGNVYLAGAGVEIDYGQALHWHLKGAEAGDPMCMLFVGLHYHQGRMTVAADPQKALHWYRQASDKGVGAASSLIGIMHEGNGLPENLPEALRWHRLALSQGQEDARNQIAGVEQKLAERAAPVRVAAPPVPPSRPAYSPLPPPLTAAPVPAVAGVIRPARRGAPLASGLLLLAGLATVANFGLWCGVVYGPERFLRLFGGEDRILLWASLTTLALVTSGLYLVAARQRRGRYLALCATLLAVCFVWGEAPRLPGLRELAVHPGLLPGLRPDGGISMWVYLASSVGMALCLVGTRRALGVAALGLAAARLALAGWAALLEFSRDGRLWWAFNAWLSSTLYGTDLHSEDPLVVTRLAAWTGIRGFYAAATLAFFLAARRQIRCAAAADTDRAGHSYRRAA